MNAAYILFWIMLYFVPSWVAVFRYRPLKGIFFANLFFGWTVVGWIITLFFAATDEDYGNENRYNYNYYQSQGRQYSNPSVLPPPTVVNMIPYIVKHSRIKVKCVDCGQHIDINASGGGQEFCCPTCGKLMVAPVVF